jgi:hypothetical protein
MLTRQQVELGVEVSCYNDFGQAVPAIGDELARYSIAWPEFKLSMIG